MTENEIQKLAKERLQKNNHVYWFPKRTWGERDVFGVFDFLAFTKRGKLLLIQLTTIQHLSDRRKKITAFFETNSIPPPNNIYVWAWDKRINDFQIRKLK